MKKLSQAKIKKYDKVLKDSTMNEEIKRGKLSKEEKIELKSHAIKKALKLKKYVRN